MDVEGRIRELKRELEYLEAQKNAGAGEGNLWADPRISPAPYVQNMPYRMPEPGPAPSPYLQKMPYRKPAPSLDGPRRPSQYIKKL